eukprot:TRINITY_DN5443_c0_g1_i3.p1 TRINITY_DN5443_c0_g1~~TRINITY_DN5443_c0_g1_i3.p1  ORF type:complete len:1414 (+),score=240.24 TRINITY_DN5443_c0_g1_i3:143-4384(+)
MIMIMRTRLMLAMAMTIAMTLMMTMMVGVGNAQPDVINAVYIITAGESITGSGFNVQVMNGARQALEEEGQGIVSFAYAETNVPSLTQTVSSLANNYTYFILSGGIFQTNIINEVAEIFISRGKLFFVVDTINSNSPNNTQAITFRQDQVAFLAGVMAGRVSFSRGGGQGRVGMLAGLELFPLKQFRNGFNNGVRYACPNCTVVGLYVDTFANEDNAGERAVDYMLAAGPSSSNNKFIDVFFGAAGGTSSAAIKHAAAAGVFVIGVDSDEYLTTFNNGSVAGANRILTSARKDTFVGVYSSIKRSVQGLFTPGNSIYDFQNNALYLTPCHEACDVVADVSDARGGLASNSLSTGVDQFISGKQISMSSNYDSSNTWYHLSFSRDIFGLAPRSLRFHGACLLADRVMLFGGVDVSGLSVPDLVWFNYGDGVWDSLFRNTNDPPAPTARSRHTAVSMPIAGTNFVQMWVFGGLTDTGASSDLWQFQFDCLGICNHGKWSHNTTSLPRLARYSHSAVVVALNEADTQPCMVVFGGFRGLDLRYSNELFAYCIDKGWSSIIPQGGDVPPEMGSHTAVVSLRRMFVYGGSGIVPNTNLWVFDFTSRSWTLYSSPTDGSPFPPHRILHASVMVRDSSMLMYGGQSQDGAVLNDMWYLDTNLMTWTLVTPRQGGGDSGEDSNGVMNRPPSVNGHTLVSLSRNQVVVVGLDTATSSSRRSAADTWIYAIGEGLICSPGTIPNTDRSACLPCLPGYYQNNETCLACPPGTSSSRTGTTFCDACEPGSFSSENGSLQCTKCNSTSYSSEFGATTCDVCPLHTSTQLRGSDNGTDCICDEDYYTMEGAGAGSVGSGACQSCLAGATCRGGSALPVPLPGWWSSVDDPFNFLRCDNEGYCKGGSPGACTDLHYGRMCSNCAPGYFRFRNQCFVCTAEGESVHRFSTVFVIVAGLIVVAVYILVRPTNTYATISITVTYLQILVLYGDFEINWPNPLLPIFNAFTFLNLDISILQSDCNYHPDILFKNTQALKLSIPFILLAWMVGYIGIMRLWVGYKNYRRSTHGSSSSSSHTTFQTTIGFKAKAYYLLAYIPRFIAADYTYSDWKKFVAKSVNVFLTLLSVLYVYMCRSTFQIFDCTKQGDGSRSLDAENWYVCYDDKWSRELLPIGLWGMIFYVAGIPALLLGTLYFGHRRHYYLLLDDDDDDNNNNNSKKNDDRNSSDDNYDAFLFQQRFGVLFCKYKPKYWWWEGIILLRKVAIVAGIIFFTRFVLLQMVFTYISLLAALILESNIRPYKFTPDNILEILLLTAATIILFIGLLIYSASGVVSSNSSSVSSVLTEGVLGPIAVTLVVLSFVTAFLFLIYQIQRRVPEGVLPHLSTCLSNNNNNQSSDSRRPRRSSSIVVGAAHSRSGDEGPSVIEMGITSS